MPFPPSSGVQLVQQDQFTPKKTHLVGSVISFSCQEGSLMDVSNACKAGCSQKNSFCPANCFPQHFEEPFLAQKSIQPSHPFPRALDQKINNH